MTAELNLLPCPFCDGTELSIETNSVQPDNFHDAWVHCNTCDADGCHGMFEGWLSSKDEAKAEAIKYWNRRATPALTGAGELPPLPGCLADRLYEAISIARHRAEHAGSTPRIKKWEATAADLRAALAADRAQQAVVAPSDDQCDKAALEVLERIALKNGVHPSEVSTDIKGHWTLKRELVRAGFDLATTPQDQGAGMQVAVDLLNAEELAALRRFDECVQDGEGYDVPKEMMQRLAEIGVVQRRSGAYYQATDFGQRVLASPAQASAAPADEARDSQYVARLKKERDGWMEEAEARGAANAKLRQDLDLREMHQKKDVWFWQGDGTDYPGSMSNSMAVVIRADQLKSILASAAMQASKGATDGAVGGA